MGMLPPSVLSVYPYRASIFLDLLLRFAMVAVCTVVALSVSFRSFHDKSCNACAASCSCEYPRVANPRSPVARTEKLQCVDAAVCTPPIAVMPRLTHFRVPIHL